MPGIVNRTQSNNRTQSMDWVRLSSAIERNRIRFPNPSNKSNPTELNPLDWVGLRSETELNRTQFISFHFNRTQFNSLIRDFGGPIHQSQPDIHKLRYSYAASITWGSACKTSLRRILSKQNTDVCKACSLPITEIMLHHITIFWEFLNLKMCTNLKLLALRIKF